MRNVSQTINLPVATKGYSQEDQQTTRRSIEQQIAGLREEYNLGMEKKNKISSLALRRFQFLLMGASSD